jgi:hypothetical protein
VEWSGVEWSGVEWSAVKCREEEWGKESGESGEVGRMEGVEWMSG